MKNILSKIGIENFGGFLYEYQPIQIDWWDNKLKTSIESIASR